MSERIPEDMSHRFWAGFFAGLGAPLFLFGQSASVRGPSNLGSVADDWRAVGNDVWAAIRKADEESGKNRKP